MFDDANQDDQAAEQGSTQGDDSDGDKVQGNGDENGLSSKLGRFAENMTKFEGYMSRLEGDMDRLEKDMGDIEKEVGRLEEEMGQLETHMDRIGECIEDIEGKMTEIE